MPDEDRRPDDPGRLTSAVEFVVAALGGGVSPDDAPAWFAPRLMARGNVVTMLAAGARFAAFREHGAEVEDVQVRGRWSARAVVRTGASRWELDLAIEPEPPHRIVSFQPRAVPDDAVAWAEVGPELRAADRWESSLAEPVTAGIGRRLTAAVDALHLVGLTAGIAVRGETVYRGSFGVTDLASRRPMPFDAVFRVGSVTKIVTALAVLLLADAGALDLDEPVPELGERAPSVRQLLLHRGGLPKDLPAGPLRPAWAPGERAEYSNIGYGLLAGVIERAAGTPYAEFCADRILSRYGLRQATMQQPGEPAPAEVTGYQVAAGRVAPVPPAVAGLPSAGGMTASGADLLTLAGLFSRADDPIVRAALSLSTPAGPGVRFTAGAAILDRPGGPLLWRGGATHGFTAELIAALDGSCDVVLLASKSPPDGLRDVATQLREAVAPGRV